MRAAPTTHPGYTVQVGNTLLTITQGDLLTFTTEALLCYSSTSLTLHSNLAQRIVGQGGPLIRAEGAKYAPAACGSTLALPAGRLPSRHLLVAVTNALRDAPTLDNLRICMRSAAAQVAHHGIESLAVPLLRAGRALAPEDALRATLSPLVDHCLGPSPLRYIIVVLDEESEAGLMARLGRHLEATLDELLELGARRARLAALQEAEAQLRPFGLLSAELLGHTLRAQLDLQLELLFQLDQRRNAGGRDHDAVLCELHQCSRQVERLWADLELLGLGAPLAERAVGG